MSEEMVMRLCILGVIIVLVLGISMFKKLLWTVFIIIAIGVITLLCLRFWDYVSPVINGYLSIWQWAFEQPDYVGLCIVIAAHMMILYVILDNPTPEEAKERREKRMANDIHLIAESHAYENLRNGRSKSGYGSDAAHPGSSYRRS